MNVGGKPIEKNNDDSNTDADDRTPLQPVSLGEIIILMRQLDTTKSTISEDFPTRISVDCMEDICIPIQDILIYCTFECCEYPDK